MIFKANLVTAETSKNSSGSVTITQKYVLDLSSEFESFISGMQYDDEIIEAGQDLDYVDAGSLEDEFWKLIKNSTNLDLTANVELSLINNKSPETVEEAKAYSKAIGVEVVAEVSFGLSSEYLVELESSLLKSVKKIYDKVKERK